MSEQASLDDYIAFCSNFIADAITGDVYHVTSSDPSGQSTVTSPTNVAQHS